MGVPPYKFVLYTFCMRACVCRSPFQWIKHNWALLYGCYRKQTSDESQEQRKQNNKIGRKRSEAHSKEKKNTHTHTSTHTKNGQVERTQLRKKWREKKKKKRKKTYTHFHWIYSLARALQYISSNQSLAHIQTGAHTKRRSREREEKKQLTHVQQFLCSKSFLPFSLQVLSCSSLVAPSHTHTPNESERANERNVLVFVCVRVSL